MTFSVDDPSLVSALDDARAEADNLQAELAALKPQAGDLAEVANGGQVLTRFVVDVEEAIRQIFVAGLSFPDPELADELEALAERARRHGLPTALRHLGNLRLRLEAVARAESTEQRHAQAGEAWQQTQQLVSWLRIFRTELDFLTVEAELSGSAGSIDPAKQDYPTRTLSAWPLGMELERGGKLLLFAVDIESESPVVLRDQLSEFNADSPFASPVISRLMQDSVDLQRSMRCLFRLEDHPVVERRGSLLFRPAFRAVPKLLAVADNFVPPRLPELTPQGPWTRPGWFDATLSYRNGRLRWTGNPRPVELPETGRLNVIKLMTCEAQGSTKIRVTARPKDDSLRILSVQTSDEDRLFLCDDPSLFRLAPSIVASCAVASATHLGTDAAPTATLLQTAAFLFGGADSAAIDALRDGVDELSDTCRGLADHYTLGLARSLLGLPGDHRAERLIDATLQLALLSAGDAVPEDVIAEVLGRPARASDLRHIDDDLLYRALWLAHEGDLADSLAQPLAQLADRRYSGKMTSKAIGAVCARSLCRYLTGEGYGDEDEEDEEDDDPYGVVEFFEAHLADLVGRGRRRRSQPMPELLELLQLGDTRALVRGFDRHGATVAELGIPQLALARPAADALFAWRNDADSSPVVAERAAVALLVIAAGGLKGLFIA